MVFQVTVSRSRFPGHDFQVTVSQVNVHDRSLLSVMSSSCLDVFPKFYSLDYYAMGIRWVWAVRNSYLFSLNQNQGLDSLPYQKQ